MNKILLFLILITISEVIMARSITSKPSGGAWNEKSTWVENVVPTKADDVTINSLVTINGTSFAPRYYEAHNLTIAASGKLVREDVGGFSSLDVTGNLINNGEVIDQADYFDMYVANSFENNGVFKPRTLKFTGSKQTINATTPIEAKSIQLAMTDTTLLALSNLQFTNCEVFGKTNDKVLNMQNFNLTFSAEKFTYDSYYDKFNSLSKLNVITRFDNEGTLVLNKSILRKNIEGSVVVKSDNVGFLGEISVNGNLSIAEGSKIYADDDQNSVKVFGDFFNYGQINDEDLSVEDEAVPPSFFKLYSIGNCSNFGKINHARLHLITNGETINLTGDYNIEIRVNQAINSDKPGGKLSIEGKVTTSEYFELWADLEIKKGGSFISTLRKTRPFYYKEAEVSITNNGIFSLCHLVNNEWGNRSYIDKKAMAMEYELRDWEGEFKGVNITVHNNETYSNLPGSVRRWWSLQPLDSAQIKYFTLKLYYDEGLLNGQKEENLKVYRSVNEGETWDVVSYDEYSVLDTVENSITIGTWSKNESMLTEFGDFVISSGDGSVPIESPVKMVLVGREGVRIGAPNRFSAHIYNVTDEKLSSFVFAIAKSDDIAFDEFHLIHQNETEILPLDSVGETTDSLALFYISHMNPNQEVSIDFIVHGIPDNLKSTQAKPFISILKLAFKIDISDRIETIAKNYILRKYQLSDDELEEYSRLVGRPFKEVEAENERRLENSSPFKKTIKHYSKEMIKCLPGGKVINATGEALELMHEIKQPFYRRLFLALQRDISVDERYMESKSTDVDVKTIECELRQSLDPNEMIGPSGYGDQHFMSEIPTMNYTILFENKKEATAPAYRIQIIDTLSAAFNVETFKFGETSHSGANYNWKMERNDNIIKWDIEGIELPPNATPPEGEGFVKFSVELANGASHGDIISNRATIIFDMNEPISTNTWVNTLDFEAPVTSMLPIKYSPGDSTVSVQCNVDDKNGSGVALISFYGSKNGEMFQKLGESYDPYVDIMLNLDSTSNHYRFYAIAEDNVSNSSKTIPEFVEFETIPLAVEEFVKQRNFQVYPNPASNSINIQTNGDLNGEYNCTLFSVFGKQCMTFKIVDQQNVHININGLNEGVYLLKIENERNQIEVHRIIKH